MNRPLSNFDIESYAKQLNIPHWYGCHSRDLLPKRQPIMSLVINIQRSNNGEGTHWTSLIIFRKTAIYFDSFGSLNPPLDIIKYIGPNVKIVHNYHRYQEYNTVNCGALCLIFLNDFWTSRKREKSQ